MREPRPLVLARRLLIATGIAMLAIAVIGGVPGSFYHWLRWVICIVSLALAGIALLTRARLLAAALVLAAIVFNPFMPFWFGRTWWIVVDLVVIATYLASLTGFSAYGVVGRLFGGAGRERSGLQTTGQSGATAGRGAPGRKKAFPRFQRGMIHQRPGVRTPGFPSAAKPRWIPRSRRPPTKTRG